MAKHVIRVSDDVKDIVHAKAVAEGTTDSEANDALVRLAVGVGTEKAGKALPAMSRHAESLVRRRAKERDCSEEAAASWLIEYAFNRLEALRKDSERRAAGKPAGASA